MTYLLASQFQFFLFFPNFAVISNLKIIWHFNFVQFFSFKYLIIFIIYILVKIFNHFNIRIVLSGRCVVNNLNLTNQFSFPGRRGFTYC